MTVRELMDRLATMPPDAVVVVNMWRNEMANGGECVTVERDVQRNAYGRWREVVNVRA